MKKILKDIQDGTFAKEWIEENRQGCPNFNRLREQEKKHPVESVGRELRTMMSWLKQKPADTSPETKKEAEPAAAQK
jgi:ketol-acid reductoisomerase